MASPAGALVKATNRRLLAAVPIVVVAAVVVLLMYPVALWLGLPLARLRMENLGNWVRVTTAPHPLAVAPGDPDAGLPSGARIEFGGADADATVERSVLVFEGRPVPTAFTLEDGAAILHGSVPGPVVKWGEALEGPLDGGQVFRFPEGVPQDAVLYLGGRVLLAGSVASVERPDGVLATFTFPDADHGPVLMNDEVVLEGVGFEADGEHLTFSVSVPFNAVLRRVTGDYAVLDAQKGTIALATPSREAPRSTEGALGLAELLVGDVDGVNRVFNLQHAPLVESDAARRIMLDDHELSPAAERPQERVDGSRATFTFTSDRGVVTVNGVEASPDTDYRREGNVISFLTTPPRNAALRQYPDYLILDPAVGTIELGVAPQVGSKVWAASYTYYDHPACGDTQLDCFFSMPQHPMPFPHWIAARIGPFFGAYPLSDSRNIVRATLYTAVGTLIALLVGGIFGILLAIVFVAIRPLESALLPWVIASQTVPIIALVPVLILLLGNAGVVVQTSMVPAAIIGAYIAFFPVTVGTVTGLRAVDPLSVDLMKSYAATPLQLFWKVRFPAAVPYLFVSLKLGAAAALVGALVAETESNNRLGLGYAIVGQVQAGNVSDVWILLLISALLGIGLVGVVGLAQRFVSPWERR